MAKLLSTIIDGFISSKKFVSGFLGEGWRIGKRGDRYALEVDDIIVRNTMTVFELLISKIRAVKGALGISQGCGKVEAVREEGDTYVLTLEDENTFRANDLVRCQSFGKSGRSYWVKVRTVSDSELMIDKSEFSEEMSVPEAGDELVQFGNTTDSARQSAIYLSADENGIPAIDVLQGIHEKSFEGCMKVRVGGLDGIVDTDFPEGIRGFGIYCENGYFKGTIAGGGGYMLRSDGTGYICNGAIWWDEQKKVHFDGEVVLQWENMPSDAKELLKGDKGDKGDSGEKGDDANLLPWVEEWNSNSPLLNSDGLLSPRIFAGKKNEITGKLTGVAIGREVAKVDAIKKTGIFGIKEDEVTFAVNAETGDAYFGGELNCKKGIIGGFSIAETYLESNNLKLSGDSILFKKDNSSVEFGALVKNINDEKINTHLYIKPLKNYSAIDAHCELGEKRGIVSIGKSEDIFMTCHYYDFEKGINQRVFQLNAESIRLAPIITSRTNKSTIALKANEISFEVSSINDYNSGLSIIGLRSISRGSGWYTLYYNPQTAEITY